MPKERTLEGGLVFGFNDDADDEQIDSFLESRGLIFDSPQTTEPVRALAPVQPQPEEGGGFLSTVGDVGLAAGKAVIRGTFETARTIGGAGVELFGQQSAQALNAIIEFQRTALADTPFGTERRADVQNPFEGQSIFAQQVFGPIADSAILAPSQDIVNATFTGSLIEGKFDVFVKKFANDLGAASPSFAATIAAFFVAGPVGAGVVGGSLEAASQFEAAIDDGETQAEALRQAQIVGTGTAVLNALPFVRPLHRFLPPTKAGVAAAILLDALSEGVTETLEGGLDPIAKLKAIPKTRDGLITLFEDIGKGVYGESGVFLTAAFMGGTTINPARRYRAAQINDIVKELEVARAIQNPVEQRIKIVEQHRKMTQLAERNANTPEGQAQISLLRSMEEDFAGGGQLTPQEEAVEVLRIQQAAPVGTPDDFLQRREGESLDDFTDRQNEFSATQDAAFTLLEQAAEQEGPTQRPSTEAVLEQLPDMGFNDLFPLRNLLSNEEVEQAIKSGFDAFNAPPEGGQIGAALLSAEDRIEQTLRRIQAPPLTSLSHPANSALKVGDPPQGLESNGDVSGDHPVFSMPKEDFWIQINTAARRIKAVIRSSISLGPGVSGAFAPATAGTGTFNISGDLVGPQDRIFLEDIQNTRIAAHELGHALDFSLFLEDRLLGFPLMKQLSEVSISDRFGRSVPENTLIDELKKMSFAIARPLQAPQAMSLEFQEYRDSAVELIADFFSVYLHNRDTAAEMAPNFTRLFEKKLENNDEIRAVVQELLLGQVAPVIPRAPDRPITNPVAAPGLIPEKPPMVMRGDDPGARLETMDLLKEVTRRKRVEVNAAYRVAQQMKEVLPKLRDREDVGARVEAIGNLRVAGDTLSAVNARVTPAKEEVQKLYQSHQELQRQRINKYLEGYSENEYIAFLDNYLPHFYTKKSTDKGKKLFSRWLKSSPNAKQRKLPTLQEAVDTLELTPVTQDAAELHKMWADVNWNVATNIRLVSELKKISSEEGVPVIMPLADAPLGYEPYNHPAVNRVFGTQTKEGKFILKEGAVGIHPDVIGVIDTMLGDPFSNRWVNKINALNAIAKKMMLSLSLFHHVALTESAQAVLARLYNPFRGVIVINAGVPLIGEHDNIIENQSLVSTPFVLGLELAKQNPEIVDRYIMGGLQGEASADVHAGLIARGLADKSAEWNNVPLLGTGVRGLAKFNEEWDNILWNKYHTGLKIFAMHDMVQEYTRQNPHASEPELRAAEESAASFINDAFGGQEWETKFWTNPKIRGITQMLMLAPDWTLSNLNIAARLFPRRPTTLARGWLNNNPQEKLRPPPVSVQKFESQRARVYWRNMSITLYTTAAALQFAIYNAFGDDDEGDEPWIWNNEPGQRGIASKVKSAVSIDVTPLYRAWGLKQADENSQRYYMHFGKQALETLGWIQHPVQTLFAKASPSVHTAIEQTLGIQSLSFGQPFETSWVRDELEGMAEIEGRATALAEKFIPFSFRDNNFAFAAPLAKGMTRWKAQRAYEHAFEAYSDPGIINKLFFDTPDYTTRLDSLVEDITDAVNKNGHDARQIIRAATSVVRGRIYRRFLDAVEREDYADMEEFATQVHRLGASQSNIRSSAANRGIDLDRDDLAAINRAFRGARQRF